MYEILRRGYFENIYVKIDLLLAVYKLMTLINLTYRMGDKKKRKDEKKDKKKDKKKDRD